MPRYKCMAMEKSYVKNGLQRQLQEIKRENHCFNTKFIDNSWNHN